MPQFWNRLKTCYRKKLTNLSDLIESAEELVESGDQFGGRQFLRQRREVDDVRVQDAAMKNKLDRFDNLTTDVFFSEMV